MRPFLFTSLLLLLSANVFGQSDTAALIESDSTISGIQDQMDFVDSLQSDVDSASLFSRPVWSSVAYKKGYFVSFGNKVTDSLTLLMNKRSESQLWRSQPWDWTVRENSSIGGIQYDALSPFINAELDGWSQFSKSYLEMPNYHSASSPRTDLTVLTGIGGGQLFGIRSMTPVDSAKQLWVDYLRSNALGLYRNEGTDGHDLNIKMRQDGVYTNGKPALPLHGFELSYFSARSGQHGGLASPNLFESNVPGIRRNFSVDNNRGELFEERLRFMYYRHLSDLTLKAQVKSAAWSVGNDLQQTEYFWDSTQVVPELDSRALYYNDSLRLTSAEISLHHDRMFGAHDSNRAYYAIGIRTGLEALTSNSVGWDAFRTDSSQVTAAFDIRVQPYIRAQGTLALQRAHVAFRGTYAFNIIGYNAGGYDFRNTLTMLMVPGEFTIGLNLLRQPEMYRFEQLYGYSYDFRTIDAPYLKNEATVNWTHGDAWKIEMMLYGAQIGGMRYLESFAELATWDGMYGRTQFGLASDRKGLNLSLQGYGAFKSSYGGFATPNWGGFAEVNYSTTVGERFQLKAGLNVSIEDAFYTPTYLVGVPIWAMQTDHLAGSYPWATVFFEARIANFIAGVRMVNALEGLADYNYYAFGATPRTDRWIQLSARWTLFN